MKALKILAYIISGAILLSILLVVGLGFALSSSWGQLKLLDYVNNHIPGKVTAKTLNLSLFGEQRIEGLTLSDKDGKVILSAEKILVNTPIATLATSREIGGSSQIDGLQATLELTPNGAFNINEALGLPSPDIQASAPFTPVLVKNVNATLKYDGSSQMAILSASGQTEQGTQKGDFKISGETGKAPKISVSATHFPVAILDQVAALKNPNTAGLYVAAIGDSIDFNIQQTGSAEGSAFKGDFKSTNLSGNLQGEFKGDTIILKAPSEVNYLITPPFYQKIKQLYPSTQYPTIDQAVPVKLTIENIVALFSGGRLDLYNSTVKANVKAGPATLGLPNSSSKLDISDLTADLTSLKGEPKAQLKINSAGKQEGSPLNLNLQMEVQKPKDNIISAQELMKALKLQAQLQGVKFLGKEWNAKMNSVANGPKIDSLITLSSEKVTLPEIQLNVDYGNLEKILTQVKITEWPVGMLNGIAPDKNLESLLGSHLELTANGTFNKQGHGQFAVNVNGKGGHAKANIVYDGQFKLLKGAESPTVTWQITPEQFTQLHQQWVTKKTDEKPPFVLAKPMTISLKIPELNVNFNNPKAASDFRAEAEFSDVAIIDTAESKKITLGKIQGQIQTRKDSPVLDWNFNVNGLGEGSILIAGNIPSPFGSPDYSLQGLEFNVHLESHGLPIGIATSLAGFDQKWSKAVEAIFGNRVEIVADTNLNKMNGPVKASVTGENGSVSLDGKISNGVFVLNQPLVAQSKITPQFGRDVFGLVLPILNSALSGDNPIVIQVAPQGFSLPIAGFDFEKTSFNSATISLGKIRFSNEGELAQLLGLLNVKSQDNFNVWFTPAYLSLNQGVLKIERFDMLVANQYPLAVWGSVDFPKDYVNLEIGLTGKAIAQAMGIKNLETDGMLIVPLRGPVGKPSINKTKVATQISRIAIETQVPEGRLIGGLLGLASGVLGGDTTPPPPTTNPLPWDTGTKEKKESKIEKAIDKVQKGVEKGVGSLINSLIPN